MADSNNNSSLIVPVTGYIALVFAIVFFSGIMGWLAKNVAVQFGALDFSVLTGTFGKISTFGEFRGSGGVGAKDGFMFALTLVPSVMLALGVVEIVQHFGGLRAAQKLLTPLLRPLMGIPGITGLALISSLQSTDAGGGMTKALKDDGYITENERTIFGMFQFTAGAALTNFLSSGAALYDIVIRESNFSLIITVCFVVMLVLKVFAANLMRLYVKRFGEEG